MSDLTVIKNNQSLKPFFDRNSKFDLKTFNFFDKSAVSALNWEGLEQEQISDRLKPIQRLLRLGVDAEEAMALCQSDRKLDSALAIASVSETAFVEAANFSDPEKAKAVHRRAREKTAGLMVVLANVIQFSSPRQATALFDNAQQIRSSLGDIPSYPELFGSLDYLQCEHCQSIFGPAAYFVDLMRMVEEYITAPNQGNEGFISLSDRRPDLENILLTCDNTNDTVPYTQIVNEVLEAKLKEKLSVDDVFEHLATAKYPRNLPFNLYLEKIRIYIAHLETHLADIYQTFHPQKPDSTPWAREYLGLSPEEYNLITTECTEDLSDRYGVEGKQGDDFWGLKEKETFLKQTKLSWQELDDLLYQNLSSGESGEIEDGVAHQFYINQGLSDEDTKKYIYLNDKGKIKIKILGSEQDEDLTLEELDRIDRFLRLAKKLDWSFADLDWVLGSISSDGTKMIDQTAIKKIAKIKRLQVQTKLPLDVLCSFWHDIKTIGKGDKPERPQDLFNRIFNNHFTILGQKPLNPDGDDKWTIDGTDDSNSLLRKRLLAALQLKDEEFIALVRGIWSDGQEITLNLANLSKLFRNSLVLKLIGSKVEEYKLLLKFLNLVSDWPMDEGSGTTLNDKVGSNNGTLGGEVNWQTVTDFPQAATREVLQFNGSDNFISFSQNQYFGNEYTVSGWFKSSSSSEQTIFAATEVDSNKHYLLIELRSNGGKLRYLHRSPAGSSSGLGTDIYSTNNYADGQWHHFTAVKNPYQMKLYVDAELVGTEEDSTSISDETKIVIGKLSAEENGRFFDGQIAAVRIWNVALPAYQLDINELIAITELAQWLKVSGFNVYELDYILYGTEYPSVEVFLPEKKMADSMKYLWQEVQLPESTSSEKEQNELNEKIASHFGIEPSLFSILAPLGADSVEAEDYILLLLTEVDTSGGCEWDKVVNCLKFISRMYLLAGKLGLTEIELRSVMERGSQAYKIESLTNLTVKDIRILYQFKQELVECFEPPEENLLEYFAAPSVEKLAKLTNWKQTEIELVIEYLGSELYQSVEGVLKLKQCFDLCFALGCRVYFLWSLCDLLKDGTASNDWLTYKDKANSVTNLAKAKYSEEQWAEVFGKLNGALQERVCQILAEFALWKLKIESSRQLSEYLLLDVEMTSCACNSKIQLGILSVQTYLQRCRMGIEPEVTKVNIPPVWWEWIMNYRLWEANRKVFLYPENYIDPSLRRDASPIFKELQDELLQSEITAATVEAAYRNYFDKLAELAKLQIVDGGIFEVQTPNSSEVETLFLLAKTQTQPHSFYYRTCEHPSENKPLWGYWEKIDLQINSEYVAPIYAFNRLFIFWVETKEITQSTGDGNKDKIVQATIKYSFQNSSQKWVAPQDLVKDLIIPSNGQVGDLTLDQKFWEQVYPYVLPELEPSPNGKQAPSPEKEITLLWGGLSGISSRLFNQNLSLSLVGLSAVTNIASDLLLAHHPLNLEEKRELSKARFNLAATTVGNLAIFAGGRSGNEGMSNVVDVFRSDSNGERKRVEDNGITLSQARSDLAATTVGNLAIFAGGRRGNNSWSDVVDVFRYDGNGNIERVEHHGITLSQARDRLAATTVGNLAIFAGGNNSNVVDVFRYDGNGNIERVEHHGLTLSEPRDRLAATTVGNLAIFAGGNGKDGRSDVVDVFRYYSNGNIERVEHHGLTLSEPRCNLAATTAGNLAIFAGGYGNNNWSDVVDVFRCDSNGNIERVEHHGFKLSQARSDLAATTAGNLAIFAGGSKPGKSNVVDVFRCDSHGKIEEVENHGFKLSQARSDLAATTVRNLAIFAGGLRNNHHSKVVDVFSIPHPTVNTLPETPSLPSNTTVTPIKNQPEGFILQQRSEFISASSVGIQLSNASRLTTSAIRHFNHTLLAQGLDGLLSLESQQIPEESAFSELFDSNQLDFDGAYGAYFWETFFHIPFLIASTLNTHQRYNEARKWYQYIFDPTQPKLPTPLSFWSLDDESDTVSDQVGNNDGQLSGDPEWKRVTDFPRSASRVVLQFDGEGDDYVDLPKTATELKLKDNSFTVGAWVKLEDMGDSENYHRVVLSSGTTGNNKALHLTVRNEKAYMGFYGNDLDGHKLLKQGTWYQIVWRYDKGNQTKAIFINGELDKSGDSDSFKGDEQVFIGSWKKNTSEHFKFKGQMANICIWDKALTDKQIFDQFLDQNCWRFLPFRGNELEELKAILTTNEAAIQAYKDNPFDPHAIARLRIGAYEKAVVMRYINNLLDWADSLFTQDTWESITQATTLYLLAHDLLGPKPENVGKFPTPEPKTFADIRKHYEGAGSIPDFIIDLENYLSDDFLSQFGDNIPFNAIDAYFCVSENKEFAQYWERVEDRLFKIRHCQNIKGIERQLALFAPPIDPNQLVRLAAAGDGSLSLATTDTVPHYRFSHLLERAKGMTSTVIQLGANILNTLEKKDAEELAVLRATQEPILLQLITKTKEKQIEEAENSLTSLQKSLDAAKVRAQHYQNLIEAGLNACEIGNVALMGAALRPQAIATSLRGLAIPGYLSPSIVGTSNGGMKFGDAINQGAVISDGIAGILTHGASIASTIAQFQRRAEDWQFQQEMAQWDAEQIEAQIEAAKVRIDLAKAELEVHQKSIQQSQEIEQFFKDKFTNKDLYQWMLGRLSSLHFQTYKIALEMAYGAQKAYQYELNQDDIYIEPIHWDSNKKGLLAGESLMLELNQLEKAYLDGNERMLEIEKIVSLREHDSAAFETLKESKTCQFNFTQQNFDDDFPNHYCRQIKTISVSIPAVVGPYQNLNAMLSQTKNTVYTKPHKEGERTNWRSQQQIAISKGINDNGLFVLNFQDERYLPFEGTGAISDWQLDMTTVSDEIVESITDVIITLSYTALT
ncbi:MAG: hypothetical protein F6K21_02915 [Symploca sp. SIO2D2]|nr:hypothetical protein [Symploca sp. SIO2D2]